MKGKPIYVLLLEDNKKDAELNIRELCRAGFDPQWKRVETEADYLAELATSPDLILADYSLPHFDGLRAAKLLRERELDIPFILISGTVGEEAAVEAMKHGATDYLLKDRIARLGAAVERALEEKRLRDERRQADAKLLASELRYRRLFEAAKDGILILDANTGEIVDVNPFLIELLGYSHADFLCKKLWEIGLFKDIVSNKAAFQKLQKAGYIRYDNLPLKTKGGCAVWVEFVSNAYDANGQQVIQCNIRDVTVRKQAELSLRESEERFRQLAENIDEVFWIANPIDGKILYVSPAFEKIWGMPCKVLYKSRQVWLDTIHRDDREQVLLAMRTKQNRGEYDETYRIVRPDGSVRWIHDRAFPLRNAAGDVFRVVGTASDVTANRNLEMQFNQSQKMEAFGLLAGGVAHDFNNLMSVVMGYSDIWLLKLPLDSPVRIPLKAIKNAGERASSLTKQLLAFSRQTVLESKVLDLNTVVRETEKMLGRLIGDDIVLSSILNPAIPRIKVDPGQIGQVLMNLAINARDAMPRGGNLTIETRTVDLDDAYVQAHLGTKPGRHVMLSVSDTGTGMPPEIVARIFEPFFTTKGVGKGTGLGLAVVYGVISQSGGSIEVESNMGAGTTFKLYFPVTLDSVHLASKSGEIEVHAGIETILVVEDEESLLEIAKESLESFGYTVLTASSGPDALKLVSANEGTIDLMLTDVVMPGMSGRELADTLKQKLPELKVIFMSGYTDNSVVRHGVNHEKVAFLQKPFTPFDLVKKVREELDKHSNVTEF